MCEVLGARLEFLKQAHVLNRDHSLIGEDFQQVDLCIGEASNVVAACLDIADGDAVAQQGDAERGAMASLPGDGASFRVSLLFRLQVFDVNDFPIDHGAAPQRAPDEGDVARRHRAVVRDKTQLLALHPQHHDIECLAQLGYTARNHVEHGLYVGGRARDDVQNRTRRGLLGERFGHFAVARLEVLEQAHVLYGDHGLIGECLEELHLSVGEAAHLIPADEDGSNRRALSQQRRSKRGFVTVLPRVGSAFRILGDGRGQVIDVNGLPVGNGSARHPLPVDGSVITDWPPR